MDKHQALLKKYLKGECTDEERKLLESWYNQQVQQESLSDDIDYKSLERHIWNKLDVQENRKIKIRYIQWAAAALILVFSAISFYMLLDKNEVEPSELAQEIVPGSNMAKLSFSDGREIDLDNIADGETVALDHIKIYKNRDGEIVYKVMESDDTEELFSLLETPKGGQYQIELADGTRAWLNAASSIRFPSVFEKQERLVEITGEVYFEVAKDSKRPFRVKTQEQLVEVLGTHFNVNAYHDEPNSVITLLEGAVKVQSFGKDYFLKPNQQIQTNLVNRSSVISEASAEYAIDWKNGIFHFSDEKVSSIMRKISRWYNVEVVFAENFVDKRMAGSISRYEDVSKVLDMLELTNVVHFQLQGRRIVVMP